jgi:branched-chain amino acid transport system substrate-binding protein
MGFRHHAARRSLDHQLRLRSMVVPLVLVAGVAACTEGAVDDADGTTAATSQPADTATAAAAPDETGSPDTEVPSTGTPDSIPASDGSIVSVYAGEPWFAGTIPAAGVAADESLPPVVVGMINTENAPTGSFPELRAAVGAAINWINAELGGVNGRPIDLVTCITSFDVAMSQACAQEMVQGNADIVISGIDLTSNGSLPILEQNDIPVISALPTTLTELKSTNTYSFSGSITGAYVAFADHAFANGADSIALAYGDFESFAVPATEYGAKVAENLGMDVTLIPFGIVTTDFLPVVQAALDSEADAIVVAAADSACSPIMNAIADFGYEGQLYMVGACAAGEIIAQIDDDVQSRVIFNSEGPPNTDGVEGPLFLDVTNRYSDEPAGGAGTVSFRAMMNVWAALARVDGELTPEAIRAEFATPATPSFWGHPYTCDGQQVPGLPALCSPQQSLFSLPDDSGDAVPAGDEWIDVPALVADL